MPVTIYGIANCDTVKAARAWLGARRVDHRFHDLRKDGIDPARLNDWADRVGWDTLLNRRGTTFRGLPAADKELIDRARAIALMLAHPALIKRPVLEQGDAVVIGFSSERYAALALA